MKEPGKTGALWRIHWSVCLPSLACDFFMLTPTEGPGTGESLVQFPDPRRRSCSGPIAVTQLLVALLVEKLIRHASASSPWGSDLAPSAATQCVA